MSDQNKSKKRCSFRSVVRGIVSALFALIGVLAVLCVIYICKEYKDSKPILTFTPEEQIGRITAFMDLVCAGDHEAAEAYLLGQPSMGAGKAPADEVSKLIWDAFVSSTSYELVGECYTTNDGLAQDLKFTCMDITSVTAKLRERSQKLLQDRVEAATDTSEIYDENGEYRTDIVNAVLVQAVNDAIKEDATTMTTEITLYLAYQTEQWWIIADQKLLDVLFGDILFYAG